MMNTNPMRFYTVVPSLPVRLNALHKIALNLWWCWNHQAVELFRRINPDQFDYEELPKRMAEFARKAFEMLSHKKFGKEELENLWDRSPIFTHNPIHENSFEESVKSILQKEWIVEIVSEMTLAGQCSCPCHQKNSGIMHIMACCDPKMIETPKFDEDGCLILKLKDEKHNTDDRDN